MYNILYKKTILSIFLLSIFCFTALAKDKKKSKSQYEKPSFVKKVYGDITTRNNFYFNANEKYKNILKSYELTKKIDFDKTFPFYFHDNADLTTYNSQFDEIIKKTGIVLQLRDYSRWRDNTYLLLGKSQFLKKQYDTSLITFQYIVTTMKPGTMNSKLEISNKERLKYIKKKEKELKEKQKIIDFKISTGKKEQAEKAEKAKNEQEDRIKEKKKEIEEIIKAKKKIIELKKKGKPIPPELLAKAKYKTDTTQIKKEKTTVKSTPKTKIDKTKPYILLNDQYVKNPYFEDSTDRKNQKPINEILKEKEIAKFEKLSLWEKIKHQPSRPEALVWMTKSMIEQNNFADAQSMIAYGKSLKKLNKTQRKDIMLLDAYFNIRRNNLPLAIEKLEDAFFFIKKKKEKGKYEFILAQLHTKNNQPADAIDYFAKAIKHSKDEDVTFYGKLKLAEMYAEHPEFANDEVVKMLTKLIKRGKNKDHADEVHYVLANYYLSQNDTTKAITELKKTIETSIINNKQKALAFLKLGEIYFIKENYLLAKNNYDSTLVYFPKDDLKYKSIEEKQIILADLYKYNLIITEQDSLQRLGKMTPKQLTEYLAELKAIQEKTLNKKSKITIEENEFANTINSNTFISNGLWYFYNPDSRGKGYNEFKRIWGNRTLQNNWRRSINNFDDTKNNTVTDNIDIKKNENKTTENKNLKIPKTPEDYIASDKLIANALFNIGEIFKNKLNNLPKAKESFDNLITRFPNSENDIKAHYYQYLIFKEQNLLGLANKEKDYILQNYPNSDIADLINKLANPTINTKDVSSSETLYKNTYQYFLDGNYDKVIYNKSVATSQYPSCIEMPQFEFLEALAFGKTKQIAAYKNALGNIISKYPNNPIKQKAQEYMIVLLTNESNIIDTTPQIDTNKIKTNIINNFTEDTTNLSVVFKINDRFTSASEIAKKIETFNKTKFKDEKIKVNPSFIENNNQIILVIKKFDALEKAQKYYMTLQFSKNEIVNADILSKVDIFIVAPTNFKKLNTQEDYNNYKLFHDKIYLK